MLAKDDDGYKTPMTMIMIMIVEVEWSVSFYFRVDLQMTMGQR